jgi:hypothetical protein
MELELIQARSLSDPPVEKVDGEQPFLISVRLYSSARCSPSFGFFCPQGTARRFFRCDENRVAGSRAPVVSGSMAMQVSRQNCQRRQNASVTSAFFLAMYHFEQYVGRDPVRPFVVDNLSPGFRTPGLCLSRLCTSGLRTSRTDIVVSGHDLVGAIAVYRAVG